jgi:outer membrane protein assembly factor BamA
VLKFFAKILLTLFLVHFLFSCSQLSNKGLRNKQEYLLYSYNYKGKKNFSNSELNQYVTQKPIKKFFGYPLGLQVYYIGDSFRDTTAIQYKIRKIDSIYSYKIEQCTDTIEKAKLIKTKKFKLDKLELKLREGNFIMRHLGSKPVFYSEIETKNSINQLERYLFSKGYFNAKVSSKADTILGYVTVKFDINAGQRFKIGTVKYESDNNAISRIIKEERLYSLFNKAEFYDENLILEERDRLDRLLKTKGYYYYKKNNIIFELDTVADIVNIQVRCNVGNDTQAAKVLYISDVQVKIDHGISLDLLTDSTENTSEEYKGIVYTFKDRYYNPKVLASKIRFGIGDKYNLENSQNTIRNLSQLNMYRQVNIVYEPDSSRENLNAKVNLLSTSKYLISDEIGFSVTQGLPGPFGSVTFMAKNIFNGCEIFVL